MSASRYGELKVPHTKQTLSYKSIEKFAETKNDIIQNNEDLIVKEYGLKIQDKNILRRHINTISIDLFKMMAEEVTRDYFNKTYLNFDNKLINVMER